MSEPLGPPDFGPGPPAYPALEEVVRVYAGPAGTLGDGKRAYPCWVTQFAPPLGLRDRVAAYAFEANGAALGAGYYDARLVGAHPATGPGSLPLYCVTCCPAGSSSSSAGPGH